MDDVLATFVHGFGIGVGGEREVTEGGVRHAVDDVRKNVQRRSTPPLRFPARLEPRRPPQLQSRHDFAT